MRVLPVLPLLLLLACAPETKLEEAFCDLLTHGPTETVTATTDDAGPEAAVDDVALTVQLVDDGAGSYSGRVRYSTDEAGSFVIGLSDDIPLEVLDASGSAVAFDDEVTGAGCSELAVRYTVPLDLDTYVLAFGPTDRASVTVVSEESDDDL